ncbi:hypothetical protein D9M68_463780 [compost metagenome]
MHLLQEHRPRADRLLQPAAVLGDVRGVVGHMAAEVQALIASGRHAAVARGAQRAHVRRRGPFGHQPLRIHRDVPAQGSASGDCEGCARWKASSFMQASKAAMVRGRPLKSQSKRRPLKICGTRQQSAMVGVSPQQ